MATIRPAQALASSCWCVGALSTMKARMAAWTVGSQLAPGAQNIVTSQYLR